MTWADRLIRFAAGDPLQPLRDGLSRLYTASAERAEQLAAHAALAPTAASEVELRALAAQEAELSGILQRALREHGLEPPVPRASTNHASHNHWGRIVADLEACRTARDALLRSQPDLTERDPSLAGPLAVVLTGLSTQASHLRDMIARADPLASN